jgi:hypothetical protein
MGYSSIATTVALGEQISAYENRSQTEASSGVGVTGADPAPDAVSGS